MLAGGRIVPSMRRPVDVKTYFAFFAAQVKPDQMKHCLTKINADGV
jgi:hypothetical protein